MGLSSLLWEFLHRAAHDMPVCLIRVREKECEEDRTHSLTEVNFWRGVPSLLLYSINWKWVTGSCPHSKFTRVCIPEGGLIGTNLEVLCPQYHCRKTFRARPIFNNFISSFLFWKWQYLLKCCGSHWEGAVLNQPLANWLYRGAN